jgi:NodT family efflux transporter outer membrane factor (OMF) lipoprotein
VIRLRTIAAAAIAVSAAACAPTTKYVPPAAPTPAAYRENAGWKAAEPADAALRGVWWEIYGDADLNALEAQVQVSNQTIRAAAARFAAARAELGGARANLYPQVSAAPSVTVGQLSGSRVISSFHDVYADYLLPGTVSYEPDLWGRIRGTIAASRATAQATAADLENVSLSLHAELALDYFALRGVDREKDLLDSAVASFERALQLTRNRFEGGLASQADVALAETQLETTRAQAVDVSVTRAALEHAIAVLAGQPPSDFVVLAAATEAAPIPVPAGLPSLLLERRPDVASAERRVAAASAQVGVTSSIYYPILSLTASGGIESSSLSKLLTGASTFWSAAPTLAVTVFDAGRRRAVQQEARAAYDESVADYQQSVLSAFREVEDQLATLRILGEEAGVQQRAVDAAERSLAQATNRYRGGLVSYLEVTSAQSVALSNERIAVELLTRRLTASVLLIKALGGGWNAARLPVLKN